jgi:hypothetical protein
MMVAHSPKLFGFVLAVVVFCAAPLVLMRINHMAPAVAWLASLAAGAWVLAAIASVTGARLLSDERGRWSLSRLQLLVWTVLVLSTFWTMFLTRLLANAADPLALSVDDNLWWLLGISGASSVASPLILGRKQASSPGIVDAPRSQGVEVGSVRDLFRGEDAGNASVVDIGRVQMVFFTLVCVCAYAAACWYAFKNHPRDALTFPPLSSDLVMLLGISHATYLVNKNVDRKIQGGSDAGDSSAVPIPPGGPT